MFPVSDDVASVGCKSIGMGDPENLGIAVGISIPSVIEPELQALELGLQKI